LDLALRAGRAAALGSGPVRGPAAGSAGSAD